MPHSKAIRQFLHNRGNSPIGETAIRSHQQVADILTSLGYPTDRKQVQYLEYKALSALQRELGAFEDWQ